MSKNIWGRMMKKVWEFLCNEYIQMSLGTGISVILLALFFKKVIGLSEVPPIEAALPALILTGFEYTLAKNKKSKDNLKRFWMRPWFWNVLLALMLAGIMLRRLWMADML
ncbi:MAG: hypothetical protein R3F48_09400 [Candidatus Zixiibacteriota bacterium]